MKIAFLTLAKRLFAVSLALMLALSVFAMSGCEDSSNKPAVTTDSVKNETVSDANSDSFDDYTGFLSTYGTKIVDENGKQYVVKAMGLSNRAMDYITDDSRVNGVHHTEETYKELSEMGFNCVRFLLNYNLFESDDEPYVYRQEGFDWVDLNIEWAKKYGMRIILDMHCPQGGYQSWDREKYKFDGLDEGDALWVNTKYQVRLAEMWAEIARYYADESAIIGYSFINEPVVAMKGIDYNNTRSSKYQECIDLYQRIMEQITEGVRKYDTNHIIFVQRIVAFKDLDKNWANWVDVNKDLNFIILDDPNVAYEFHFYKPGDYTMQEIGDTGKSTIYGEGKGVQFKNISRYLKQYKDFSERYDVPLFCGEYGLKVLCYYENAAGENRGGAEWVADVLGYFIENGIGSGYHCYYGGTASKTDYGMYVTWDTIQVGGPQRDERVYNALKDTLAKYN